MGSIKGMHSTHQLIELIKLHDLDKFFMDFLGKILSLLIWLKFLLQIIVKSICILNLLDWFVLDLSDSFNLKK